MSDEKLKPCPFCGNEKLVILTCVALTIYDWKVLCEHCNVFVRGYTKEEAIDAWNRRTK